jgi:hypothetical protein
MKLVLTIILFSISSPFLFAQTARDTIYSSFVLDQRRNSFKDHLLNTVLFKNMEQVLDSTTEEQFRESCWAIAQFIVQSTSIEKGFAQLFDKYQTLDYSTKRSFLEAVYASYSKEYEKEIGTLLITETVPKLFAMQAVYLYRMHPNKTTTEFIQTYLANRFPHYEKIALLAELVKYLQHYQTELHQKTPSLTKLFEHQKKVGSKMIYSFQRWNRDYPGIAIIQNADGSFVREKSGRILMIEQLARAGSNLPYFLTNGNTPQGIFSITGTEVSRNLFIGPTPNFQMLMPYEADSAFWHTTYDNKKDSLSNYKNLLPESWSNYAPITESYYAGKIGRSEILSHGTTIDPEYFKGKPYYPLTPTLGCLCAKEIWNKTTGRLDQSEQFKLLNGFLSTSGTTGYLIVINLDNQQKAVSKKEIQLILERKKAPVRVP